MSLKNMSKLQEILLIVVKLLGLCPMLHFLLPSGNGRKAELSCLFTNFEIMKKGIKKTKVSYPDHTVSVVRAGARSPFLLLQDPFPDPHRNREAAQMSAGQIQAG